jgi:hypothetical protein
MLMHYKDMYMPEHLSFVFTDTVKKFKLYISQIVIPRIILSVLFIIIMLTVICRQTILRTITIKEVLILVTNILDQIVLKV